jgi:hypothetical protein
VGEERRPEFVIATNPAYRRQNVGYLMDAAAALGIPGFNDGGSTYKYKRPNANAPHTAPLTRPPFKIGAKSYGSIKELIEWSENEYNRTLAYYQNEIDAGRASVLPYDTLRGDLLRTQQLNFNLGASIQNRIKALRNEKQKAEDTIKDKKSSKKEVSKAKEKKKDATEKIRELKKELRLDLPQALAEIQTALDSNATEKLTGGGGAGGGAAAQEFGLSQARYDLFRSFAGNIVGGGSLGGMTFAGPSGVFSGGFNPRTSAAIASTSPKGGGTSTVQTAAGAGGKTVNITNNYQEQPTDPHTWSKQVAWEAGAAF